MHRACPQGEHDCPSLKTISSCSSLDVRKIFTKQNRGMRNRAPHLWALHMHQKPPLASGLSRRGEATVKGEKEEEEKSLACTSGHSENSVLEFIRLKCKSKI
jgi:hypothetical protein